MMQSLRISSLGFVKSCAQNILFGALTVPLFFSTASAQAQPAPGTEQGVCKTLQTIQTLLEGASIVVVTLAIMWAGYRFLFARAEISECGKILAAGVLIGSAGTIAGMLIGKRTCDDTALASCKVPPATVITAKADPTASSYAHLLRLLNEA